MSIDDLDVLMIGFGAAGEEAAARAVSENQPLTAHDIPRGLTA